MNFEYEVLAFHCISIVILGMFFFYKKRFLIISHNDFAKLNKTIYINKSTNC